MSIPAGIECVNLKGKQYPLTGAVLEYAQKEKGLVSLEVTLIQIPTEENGSLAICSATARFEGDRVYTDIGDASPRSTGAQMVPHLCRLASTRAIGRALRWGCGITQAVYEEMGGEGPEDSGHDRAEPAQGFRPAVPAPGGGEVGTKRTGLKTADGSGTGKFCEREGCGVELSGPEVAASWKKWKKFYCSADSAALEAKLAQNPAV